MIENFDAMTREELQERIDGGFPGIPVLAGKILRFYATHKIAAIDFRMAGKIIEALREERECERLYRAVPRSLRW